MKRRSSYVVPRQPDFEIDLTTADGILAYTAFYVGLVGNLAGMCMTDHLGDEGIVRDMHDVIGAVGAVNSGLALLADELRRQRKQCDTGPIAEQEG